MPTLGKIFTVERKSTNDDDTLSQPPSSSTQVSMGVDEDDPSRAKANVSELANDNNDIDADNDTQRQQTKPTRPLTAYHIFFYYPDDGR